LPRFSSGFILTVPGTVVAILTAVFLIAPRLKPTVCLENPGGRLIHVYVERNSTLADYDAEKGITVSPSDARTPGEIGHYTIQVAGFKGKDLPLYWSLYNATAGQPVSDRALRNVLAGTVRATGCGAQGGTPFWVPAITNPGLYKVNVVLKDPGGGELDFTFSDPFQVKRKLRHAAAA